MPRLSEVESMRQSKTYKPLEGPSPQFGPSHSKVRRQAFQQPVPKLAFVVLTGCLCAHPRMSHACESHGPRVAEASRKAAGRSAKIYVSCETCSHRTRAVELHRDRVQVAESKGLGAARRAAVSAHMAATSCDQSLGVAHARSAGWVWTSQGLSNHGQGRHLRFLARD